MTAGKAAPGDGNHHEATSMPRVIGQYLILDEIASGGMATVHLAHVQGAQGQADHFVAVKCMHPHYARDPDFVSMFLDEANLCARIRHQNVVATIDVSQGRNTLLLVLELVNGESLSRLIKTVHGRNERVPQAVISAVVCDMLSGLHAAHEATDEDGNGLMIVHRDVSPHNVLVDTDGVAKVLDFGVAKARGRVQQTQKGQLKGKLAYMSPEQARGRAVDRRSDVFAAGIVLWEMLVGKRLFGADNEAALLVALLMEKPPAPSSRDAALAPFDSLVLKALATNPDDRFSTAAEMAAALRQLIAPAGRTEVAEWLKAEAKAALTRRSELLNRAQRNLARRAAAPVSQTGPTDSMPSRDATGESIWDSSSTYDVGDDTIAAALNNPLLPQGSSQTAEATLPLYSPPAGEVGSPMPPPSRSSDRGIPAPPPSFGARPTQSGDGFPAPRDSSRGLPAPRDSSRGFPAPRDSSRGFPTPQDSGPSPPAARPSNRGFASLNQVPGYATAVGFSTEHEPRVETGRSQVTSVALTMSDLPPPLEANHVRRLKVFAVLSGAVGALGATALLLLLSPKHGPHPRSHAAVAAVATAEAAVPNRVTAPPPSSASSDTSAKPSASGPVANSKATDPR